MRNEALHFETVAAGLRIKQYIYVVVIYLSQVIFVFLLFLSMVMYANEVQTKEK